MRDPVSREEGDRLLMLLVQRLRTVPKEQFDFKHWVGLDWKGKEDLSCGTTACGLGWATTIPELRAMGLRMLPLAFGSAGVPSLRQPDGFGYAPSGAVEQAAEVSRVLFGLNSDEHLFLFYPADDEDRDVDIQVTPTMLADRIEEFVRSGRVVPDHRDW